MKADMDGLKVVAEFSGLKVRPVRFEWRSREYRVERVTVEFERKDGGRKYLCFGVDTGGMVAELRLDRQNLQFSLFGMEAAEGGR